MKCTRAIQVFEGSSALFLFLLLASLVEYLYFHFKISFVARSLVEKYVIDEVKFKDREMIFVCSKYFS